MPADINSVTLVARLTAQPELKGANSNVLPLRLAFTTREKQGDDWGDKSNYVDAVLYGRQAETMARFLGKGTRVAISGELGYQEWQAQDGTKRSRVQIVVRSIQLMDPKPQAAPQGESPAREIVAQLKSEMGGEVLSDDDIPF
jgi:single-strand DNA-binding protein